MAELNKSWLPEIGSLEQQLLSQDQSDRSHANTVAAQAESNAKGYAANVAGQAETNAKGYADTKKAEAISAAASDATSKANTAETNAKSYADTKKQEAISAAASDATSKANTAETNAINYAERYGIGTIKSYLNDGRGSGLFVMNGNPVTIPDGYTGYDYGAIVAIDHNYGGNVAEIVIPHALPNTMFFRNRRTAAFSEVYTNENLTLPEDKAAGAVGSYASAILDEGISDKSFGQTVSGGNLTPTSSAASAGAGGSLSGTWRCMGYSSDGSIEAGITLWLRIA